MRLRHLLALTALLTPLLVTTAAAGVERSPSAVVTTREVIGTSVEGQPIRAIHRARQGATRTLLVIGSMHGNERAGMRVIRRLRDRANLPADLDLWLVPTINPDGTAADRRTNARGVDLNRNFPYRWRSSPRGLTWSGPGSLSEPESRALRQFALRVQPRLTVVFHQPLFGVGANDGGRPIVRALARGMKLPVTDLRCGSVCHGTFTDWANNRIAGLALTVEFGRRAPDWRIGRAAAALVQVGSALS